MIKTRVTELGMRVMTKVWKDQNDQLCTEIILSVPAREDGAEPKMIEIRRPERQRNWP